MEGPTPVSALIHAATMVAAGVFLIARVYPLVAVVPGVASSADTAPVAAMHAPAAAASAPAPAAASTPAGHGSEAHAAPPAATVTAGHGPADRPSVALQVVGWIGAITALFAALIAVAQTDIKRILAYSTVSQLGYMFLGLATGGVAVGMFHLITHAFFKALLFLGAGSVIHGCHEEQDIRRMGGLWRRMPVTFCTYAVGMMALSGVPFLFSGFWSKDEILHAAVLWQPSKWPFLLAAAAALLTAFYMTRQMCFVFWGDYRGGIDAAHEDAHGHGAGGGGHAGAVHESPPVMTIPLALLAVGTVLLGVVGTPVWPWFHAFLGGHPAHFVRAVDVGVLLVILMSIAICATGIGLGWRLYGGRRVLTAVGPDPLEEVRPGWFAVLRGRFFVDELYERSFIRWQAACARFSDWLDRQVWSGVVRGVSLAALGVAWVARLLDEYGVNLGFDGGCDRVRRSGRWLALLQDGQIQHYLRALAAGIALLAFYLIWK
jgi:NADH-quinone oxidoreductase subunit L